MTAIGKTFTHKDEEWIVTDETNDAFICRRPMACLVRSDSPLKKSGRRCCASR